MIQQNFVLVSPQELHSLIVDAVSVAVQQIQLPQKIDPLPEYLTVEQACQFLNLAKPTIYANVCNRTIPFIKKGKKLYFSMTDLEQWLQDGKKQTKHEIIKGIKLGKENLSQKTSPRK